MRCHVITTLLLWLLQAHGLSQYLFIEIIPKNKRRILVGSVYRPHRDVQIDLFINILENLSVEYNESIILGNFNNNLLCNNTLIGLMSSLGLFSVNTLILTHYHGCTNSLIDLVFVNNLSKVVLYDHHHHINIQQEEYEYRGLKRICL